MYLSRGDVRIGRRVLCTKVATGVGNGGVGERAIWHADRAQRSVVLAGFGSSLLIQNGGDLRQFLPFTCPISLDEFERQASIPLIRVHAKL